MGPGGQQQSAPDPGPSDAATPEQVAVNVAAVLDKTLTRALGDGARVTVSPGLRPGLATATFRIDTADGHAQGWAMVTDAYGCAPGLCSASAITNGRLGYYAPGGDGKVGESAWAFDRAGGGAVVVYLWTIERSGKDDKSITERSPPPR